MGLEGTVTMNGVTEINEVVQEGVGITKNAVNSINNIDTIFNTMSMIERIAVISLGFVALLLMIIVVILCISVCCSKRKLSLLKEMSRERKQLSWQELDAELLKIDQNWKELYETSDESDLDLCMNDYDKDASKQVSEIIEHPDDNGEFNLGFKTSVNLDFDQFRVYFKTENNKLFLEKESHNNFLT